jgi:hypothetical protein
VLTEVNLLRANFTGKCFGWNSSVPRPLGYENQLTEQEHLVLATSLAEALPFGNFTLKPITYERLFFDAGFPHPDSAQGSGGGLQPMTLRTDARWVHEDEPRFRQTPFNFSVFYIFDQMEMALSTDIMGDPSHDPSLTHHSEHGHVVKDSRYDWGLGGGGPLSRGLDRNASVSRWTTSIAFWADYYSTPALEHLECPLEGWEFPETFKAVFGTAPTGSPTLKPTGYPSTPPTPVPTGDQWFSLNATTDFGARGGDTITFQGTGLKVDQAYHCMFKVYRDFGSVKKENFRTEVRVVVFAFVCTMFVACVC